MNVDSRIAHAFEEGVGNMPATHIIVYQPHLHALAGFVYQRVGDKTSQRVVVDDVHINVYMVAGETYLTQE